MFVKKHPLRFESTVILIVDKVDQQMVDTVNVVW